jgi:protocatechuate 3,4-dioxygenase beta subunit
MKSTIPLLILAMVGAIGVYLITLRSQSVETTFAPSPKPTTSPTDSVSCIPTFRDGGGPYYQANTPLRTNLAPETNTGEMLTVTGTIVAADCVTPLANVILDIWQANESGNYEDEWYRGRVETNDRGEYSFTTVVPKGYGEGTAYRPPHIHFKVWQNNQELVTSQMFLPASRAQGIEEAYIMKLETETKNGVTSHQGQHTIILPE